MPTMSFVGGGRGDYIQETTYKYVGSGAGEYKVQAIGGGCCGMRCLLGVVLAAAAALLVIFVAVPMAISTTPAPGRFDCAAGFDNWEVGWSDSKKDWCCDHARRGCPRAALAPHRQPSHVTSLRKMARAAASPSPAPVRDNTVGGFDCAQGFDDWVHAWDVDKKAWCCQHGGKGCPPLMKASD